MSQTPSRATKRASRFAKTTPVQEVAIFVVAVLAVFTKEEQGKQRYMNVLLESTQGVVTKAHLAQVNKAVFARLEAENQVPPSDVKDIVIMSISFCGAMTPETFDPAMAAPMGQA